MGIRETTKKKSVLMIIGALFALFILYLLFNNGGGVRTKEKEFFLKNSRGKYNLVEVSLPEGKGKKPVVLIAHGFAGTLHSGGAKELGERLAEKGVMAIRVDFDAYLEPDHKAERERSYPLSQMESDALNALDTVIKEYDGDPDDVSLYGRSYGGRLMMMMANESSGGYDYKKLALVAPAGDAIAFERYLGGKEKYREMKKEAEKDGYATKLGVKIEPEWFEDVESYDPTEHGDKFGDKPVLLIYNTKDKIVYPDTSIRCAEAYRNHKIIKVSTDDGHGYEMGYKESELKDELMDEIVSFLTD